MSMATSTSTLQTTPGPSFFFTTKETVHSKKLDSRTKPPLMGTAAPSRAWEWISPTTITMAQKIGLAKPAKGLGIALADYDRDGHIDIYVANDSWPEFLFHNKGNGTFEEVG